MNEQAGLDATIQMPEQASTLAPLVDDLYYDIFWISVAFFVAIVGAMVYFSWTFRRRKGVKSKPPGHHTVLELFWTFSPLILLAYMFHQGFSGYMMMAVPPENAVNIRVSARQWSWQFEHANGLSEAELWAPVNEPVRLIMASVPRNATPSGGAVLHSLFVPAFRVKRDIVPGMYTSLWFEATREGNFDLYCTEYCGTDHSGMHTTVRVVSREAYDQHLIDGFSMPAEFETPVAWGEQLFQEQGCPSCHVMSDTGPRLENVAGTPQPIVGGPPRVADLEYLRESLREPNAAIVDGYAGAQMTSFAHLQEMQLDAIISYVASLSDQGDDIVTELHSAHEWRPGWETTAPPAEQ